ncbi:hypothetical protein EJ04DRAFT_535871 [Polyplosphaeria fusca]|uniref:Uncharacterized protein n=1 Tax=Polyplosphaeria fusca TaxID=682080 RepID=A0A9P4V1X0_9PLEO|nr:hypothetical protein EJ04DRAFT_535871 [Polyplosphaeria fusca]
MTVSAVGERTSKLDKLSSLPKLIISPGSAHHNSLPSFLEYADRVKLAPTRTVYVGTHFEYTAALSLLRLGFSLLRTGKKSDAGIDLIGHWILPLDHLPAPIPVIVQCKARQSGLGPSHVRELEGAFHGIPADWRKKDVLGLLVSTCKATKGVLDALGGNRWPMAFVKISRTGTIQQFLWNPSAAERGLEGVGVTIRHKPRVLLPEQEIEEYDREANGLMKKRKKRKRKSVEIAGTNKDIQLTWMGSPMFPDREGLDRETEALMGVLAGEVEAEGREGPVKSKSVVKSTPSKVQRRVQRKVQGKGAAKTAPGLPKRRGRPPGSRNRITAAPLAPRKRGRPPGSKNKAKPATSSCSSDIG